MTKLWLSALLATTFIASTPQSSIAQAPTNQASKTETGASCCAAHKPLCGKLDKNGRCAGCGMLMGPAPGTEGTNTPKKKSHQQRRVFKREKPGQN